MDIADPTDPALKTLQKIRAYDEALASGQPRGQASAAVGAPSAVDEEGVRRQAEAAWKGQPALRAEFLDDKAAYLAFRVAEAAGRTRMVGGAVVSAHRSSAGGQRGTV